MARMSSIPAHTRPKSKFKISKINSFVLEGSQKRQIYYVEWMSDTERKLIKSRPSELEKPLIRQFWSNLATECLQYEEKKIASVPTSVEEDEKYNENLKMRGQRMELFSSGQKFENGREPAGTAEDPIELDANSTISLSDDDKEECSSEAAFEDGIEIIELSDGEYASEEEIIVEEAGGHGGDRD